MKKIMSMLLALALLQGGLTALPMGTAAEEAPMLYTAEAPDDPVISRNAPAYAGSGENPAAANDAYYYTSWRSVPEDYIAYDLSGIPAERRQRVIAVWYNLSTYDNVGVYVNKSGEPVDYTIEINGAPGGSYPESGWTTAAAVTDNGYSSRQHIVELEGCNWIRMRVTRASGDQINVNFDIHSITEDFADSWIFFGDSITAGSMVNAFGTGFATFVNQLDSRYFPVQENGGIGGTTSQDGRAHIDQWLSVSPARYVSIAYGTNDCWGNPNNVQRYYENTRYMIEAVLAAGKIPVLPKIPFSTNPDVGDNVGAYNAVVDRLYSEYGERLVHGPDFDAYFQAHPEGLSGDGVHPSSEGYEEMRRLWAQTMLENVYNRLENQPAAATGDVNADGAFDLTDLVAMQRWLLAVPGAVLSDPMAGDLAADGRLNGFDLGRMRLTLTGQKQDSGDTQAAASAEQAD